MLQETGEWIENEEFCYFQQVWTVQNVTAPQISLFMNLRPNNREVVQSRTRLDKAACGSAVFLSCASREWLIAASQTTGAKGEKFVSKDCAPKKSHAALHNLSNFPTTVGDIFYQFNDSAPLNNSFEVLVLFLKVNELASLKFGSSEKSVMSALVFLLLRV
jgi:hypothetical protein